MKEKDFIKLRCKIHQDFKRWFSYSKKFNCLYCDWNARTEDLDKLNKFVGSSFKVIFCLPCSVFIYFDKYSFKSL